jgi:glycosyltransferase involved in cell wall biosynthesis
MRLVICGDGPERSHLERKAAGLGITSSVRFAGYTSDPISEMAKADVTVLSSEYEGFGNVLVESMACGTPVVSTACPFGPSEILQDGEYGRLVPVGDAAALAEAILQTLKHPVSSVVLRRRASEFSAAAITDAYIDAAAPDWRLTPQ